jgi:soluble lytic murein transglycosylase
MRPVFAVFMLIATLICPALAQAGDLATLFERWETLKDKDSPTPRFEDGLNFLTEYPGWPDEKSIRMRTEAAAFSEQPERSLMREFCEIMPPISGRGMLACATAQAADEKSCGAWLHQGWIQGDFSENEEQAILARYSTQIAADAHLARTERLLYEGKPTAARRMLPLLPAENHPLYEAWIGLAARDRAAEDLWRTLPENAQKSPGLLFARLSNARKSGQMDTLIALAKKVPAHAPYPEQWWEHQQIAAREAITKQRYDDALSVLSPHGALEGEDLAEALWLKGWILLEFKGNASAAHKDFHALYDHVKTPVSKARAAYWAARAATKNGNADIAQQWYNKAARNPTVFYGQLAHLALHPAKPLVLPEEPHFSAAQKDMFEVAPLVKIIRYLSEEGAHKQRDRFLIHLTNATETQAQLTLASNLAREVGGISSAVKVAKYALRKQAIMVESGWPRIDLPTPIAIEPALALAITRQESEFDPKAVSSANARGLMQLLPSTAKHVADQHDLDYDRDSLFNPKENLTLGTTYLGQMVSGFDGSYILGIASYNAGPGTVRKWLKTYGPPPKTLEGSINWIESIPFTETRNYVQRVLENVQVYRTLAQPEAPPTLDQDLVR